MRLNASIATLVLAGLSLLPTPLLAKQPSPAAHKETTAAKKHTHRKTTDEASPQTHKKRRKSRPRQEDDPEPVTMSRVHAASRTHKRATHIASAPETGKLPQTPDSEAPRKATPEDFIRAAGLSIDPKETAIASSGVSHPLDDNEETPRSALPPAKVAPAVRPATAASPRPAAQPAAREIVADDTAAPVIQPVLYNKRGRLIVPPPLKGSHEILVRQNIVADREGLDRIKDDDDLENMRSHRLLVSIPLSDALDVDERLPANRRYCRPWTAQFLMALARAHYARFHTPLQVNSAVRTVEFQQRLLRINGNAAPAEGETASPHLTGQAVDLAKHGLSMTEIAWMRGYLLPLVQQGKIDVEEEFQQSCFHISVYKRYLPGAGTPNREISSGNSGTATLATAMP